VLPSLVARIGSLGTDHLATDPIGNVPSSAVPWKPPDGRPARTQICTSSMELQRPKNVWLSRLVEVLKASCIALILTLADAENTEMHSSGSKIEPAVINGR